MKRRLLIMITLLLPASLSGCRGLGEKSSSLSAVYLIAAIASALLLVCCLLLKSKSGWLVLLFSSVLTVNVGYFCLSVSGTLESALAANRLAYLGSVLLPLSMMMIILRVCRMKYPRWLPATLISVAAAVFIVAASPGILDIYYKEVYLDTSGGFTVLRKVYGDWHFIYHIYLFGYFGATVSLTVRSLLKKKLTAFSHSVMLAAAVFINIGIWLIEQLVETNFEILSLSYIISELFLLGLHSLISENDRLRALAAQPEEDTEKSIAPTEEHPETLTSEQAETFISGISSLTPTERHIFDLYIEHKTTKEIMEQLNIKENTLKFHNKNIYGKLGVSSRKQLIATYSDLNRE
jgi:DNA-binding CsgD family transcriptional regulator